MDGEGLLTPVFSVLRGTKMKRFALRRLILLPFGLLLLVVFLAAFHPAGTVDVPPRPTITATATSAATPTLAATPSSTRAADTATTIYLHRDPAVAGLWTAVQWQDAQGEWHDVPGWQAPFNEYGVVAWAVAESEWGGGPMRWLVYNAAGEEALIATSSFTLPQKKGEQVHLAIQVAE
jgi:hypothetical protein